MDTYHPEFMAWSKHYRLLGSALFLSGVSSVLIALRINRLAILPFAVLIPVAFGVPLLILYRRRLADFKEGWIQEHPLGPSTVPPATARSPYRCPICGETIPISKGYWFDIRVHELKVHPEYLRWYGRIRLVIALVLVSVFPMIILFPVEFGPAYELVPILGLFIAGGTIGAYVSIGQRRFKRNWQDQQGRLSA